MALCRLVTMTMGVDDAPILTALLPLMVVSCCVSCVQGAPLLPVAIEWRWYLLVTILELQLFFGCVVVRPLLALCKEKVKDAT